MDLVDVRALVLQRVVHLGVVDPLAVERDERVGDRLVRLDGDEHFFLAVGVQQHQVGARLHRARVADLGPASTGRWPLARRAHVDDVVVVLDRLVGRDRAADRC